MRQILQRLLTFLFLLVAALTGLPQDEAVNPSFNVLVVASPVKDHATMMAAARPVLEKMANDNHFNLDFTDDTSQINPENLARYQVFVMLQLAPFDITSSQQAALEQFVRSGKGWVGIHAAGLTGKGFLAPQRKYWQWFEDFMGGVIYSPHPASQKATLVVEDRSHPATRHLPARLELSEEWYEFDKSPRSQVHVLASVDESTYHPNKPMGDHPIIWSNPRYRRMIYIGVGSDPALLRNDAYTTLLRDAILWAGSPSDTGQKKAVVLPPIPMKRGIIQYEKRYMLKQVLSDAEKLRWMRLAASQPIPGFPDSKLTITSEDKERGSLSGTAMCKVVTGEKGSYYYLRWDWAMKTTDSGYFLMTNHYYEKPVEKGISNEFSKIEYRWWDYRKGHPWSPADGKLFAGLDSVTSSFAGSVYALEDQAAAASGSVASGTHPAGVKTGPDQRVSRWAASSSPRFRVLALYENGGHHLEYSKRAKIWLDQLAADSNFRIDYITRPDTITEKYLSDYALIIQLDYAPYAWKPEAMAAFTKYIEEGRGGWIGMHHATLLGEFDGYPMWPWFSNFMGGIRWKDYIARFASGVVHVENRDHPVMMDVPDSFVVEKEEWYTWDKSPRPNVQVLANVDEGSYRPDTSVKMGDHPVIWSNPKMKARNVYIFMGHSPMLFDNEAYKQILTNSIFWAAATKTVKPMAGHAKFKALALYSTNVESDHVDFARDAIRYYSALAAEKGFVFDTTTNWDNLNNENLRNYQVVLWLNEFPKTDAQRAAFEGYMQHGGAWLGFHVAGYNDRYTKWRWFVDMLGGAVFYNNNWPPLPARLIVNDQKHPATRRLPARYTAPINEWYGWNPNPRQNKDVRVLMTLDTSNYPLGKKDVIRDGDIPVVWTNTKYRMLYINMGHGDQIFVSPIQNRLFEDAILWLGEGEKK